MGITVADIRAGMSAQQPPRLFDALPADATPAYCNLKTPPSEKAALCRKYCDALWAAFHPYADLDFVQDFPVHTHARF